MRCAEAILARRDERQDEQVRLLRDTGCPVVSLTIVSPGTLKDDEVAQQAFELAVGALTTLCTERDWAVVARHAVSGVAGPELLVALDAPAEMLKRALIDLEEGEPCGRLWDLDVLERLDCAGLPVIVNRARLGLSPRCCLLCDEPAAVCARSHRHPLPTLLVAREALAADLRVVEARAAAALAVDALLVEARLTPKPGLVDAANSGAHDDMDLGLLERSAEALRDWFVACWLLGALHPGASDALVRLGQRAETTLAVATRGVNTHRGALYCFGLVLAAWGTLTAKRHSVSGTDETSVPEPVDPSVFEPVEETQPAPLSEPDEETQPAPVSELVEEMFDRVQIPELLAAAARLAVPLHERWLAGVMDDDSHGSRAYRELGLEGAHGEAASGFASVTEAGLPALRSRRELTGDEDDALRWTLVSLMTRTADTNLFARGSSEAVDSVRAWARDILCRRPDPAALRRLLVDADLWFSTHRWSPGGSADLLALTWFLDRLGD